MYMLLYDIEALVSAIGIALSEVYIISFLVKSNRVQYAYHLFPLAHALLLLESVRTPHALETQVLTFAVSLATTLNVYNTWIPHTITSSRYMEVDLSPPHHEKLVYDLLLPRYTRNFSPWGYLLQVSYSLVVFTHVAFRSFAFAHAIRHAQLAFS